jgi:hypothetical protein
MADLPQYVHEPKPEGALFGPEADWWHNAVVSQWHSSWYVYAEGYRRAADALVEVAAAEREKSA